MEREPHLRYGNDRTERWLRFARDTGIALVGVAALAGLARDLSATRGPVVAWIIVTLLGGAAGLFAWSLLEARDAGHADRPSDGTRNRTARNGAQSLPGGDIDPYAAVLFVPPGLFPAQRRPSVALGIRYRARRRSGPSARTAPRSVRMRTRRSPAACAAVRTRRPVARAARRLPPTAA